MKSAHDLKWMPGFVFYNEYDLAARKLCQKIILNTIKKDLIEINRAIRFLEVETPISTPPELLKSHEEANFDLVKVSYRDKEKYLRPETTLGTYAALRALFPQKDNRPKQLPLVVYQTGKVFRAEQIRPFSELRFIEFYQMEFQLFHTLDTKADYFQTCLESMLKSIKQCCKESNSVEVSLDNLAHYSIKTVDIYSGEYEVAAISERKDFEESKVIEISIGLDRLTFLQTLLET